MCQSIVATSHRGSKEEGGGGGHITFLRFSAMLNMKFCHLVVKKVVVGTRSYRTFLVKGVRRPNIADYHKTCLAGFLHRVIIFKRVV